MSEIVKANDGDFYKDYFVVGQSGSEELVTDITKANYFREKEVERIVNHKDLSGVILFCSIIGFVVFLILYYLSYDTLTLKSFLYASIPVFLVLVIRPLYRLYSIRRANADLDRTYRVEGIIKMKEEVFKFPSTVEYISKVYREKGELTLLDMIIAKKYVEAKIKQTEIEYAKNPQIKNGTVKLIEEYKEEAKRIHIQCAYLSSYIYEHSYYSNN
ncbi:hypothetical protein [Acinetobacter baumannii]|uniref:hypothetical protein n=1 Tax=Acinetobacter baumannii TaxID=470 RepID=UPI001113E61F|nr:hypothetical protein [Acinetobacter baumannii]